MAHDQIDTKPATETREHTRWLTGTGAGLGVAVITLALTVPQGPLGFLGILAGVLLALGIALDY